MKIIYDRRDRKHPETRGSDRGRRSGHQDRQYRVPGKGMGANQIREYVTRSHFRITYDSTGPIVSSNGLVYKWFIANIEIPSEYIVPTGVYEEYEQLD